MKLQSFELDVIDFIPAIVLNIFYPCFFACFCQFHGEILIIFHEVMKLRSLELIRRYLKVSVVTPANEHVRVFL